MSSISFIQKSNNNVVTTGGTTIYPVTTINAVYVNASKTLNEVLFDDYDNTNEDIRNNGIYAWMQNISDKVNNSVDYREFNDYKNTVEQIGTDIADTKQIANKNKSDLETATLALSNKIKELENRIKALEDGQD